MKGLADLEQGHGGGQDWSGVTQPRTGECPARGCVLFYRGMFLRMR